jgi:hypothetical protein
MSLLAGCCVLAVSSVALAEDRLDNAQLDNVTAGALFGGGSFGGFVGGLFGFPRPQQPSGPVVVVDNEVIPVTVESETTSLPGGGTQTNTTTTSIVPGKYTQFQQTNRLTGGGTSPGTFASFSD